MLLPGAFYYLNEIQKPPIEALRRHRVPMAVAASLNPGSSPVASLLTAMNMSCVLFGLTPEEPCVARPSMPLKLLAYRLKRDCRKYGCRLVPLGYRTPQ